MSPARSGHRTPRRARASAWRVTSHARSLRARSAIRARRRRRRALWRAGVAGRPGRERSRRPSRDVVRTGGQRAPEAGHRRRGRSSARPVQDVDVGVPRGEPVGDATGPVRGVVVDHEDRRRHAAAPSAECGADGGEREPAEVLRLGVATRWTTSRRGALQSSRRRVGRPAEAQAADASGRAVVPGGRCARTPDGRRRRRPDSPGAAAARCGHRDRAASGPGPATAPPMSAAGRSPAGAAAACVRPAPPAPSGSTVRVGCR